MKCQLNTISFTNKQNTNNSKSDPKLNLKTQPADSFIRFRGEEKKQNQNNAIKAMLLAMMIGTASNAVSEDRVDSKDAAIYAKPTIDYKWWDKFSPREKMVIEKTENEIAKIYLNTQKKVPIDSAVVIAERIDAQREDLQLIKDLLEDYSENRERNNYLVDSKHISPRKEQLKQKALVEVLNYTYETGKVLRYNSQNIKGICKNINADKDEAAFVAMFLKPYLSINKNSQKEDETNSKFYGNLEELEYTNKD